MNVQEAIAGLLEALSTPPDRNDLGRLARMHTCCQSLIDMAESEAVRGVAQALCVLLERVILDEAAEPDAAIALIAPAINTLERLQQGQEADWQALAGQLAQAAGGGGGVPPPPPERAKPAVPEGLGAVEAVPGEGAAQSAAAEGNPEEPYESEPLIIDRGEAEHLQGFLDEATEHMDAIEAGLLEVESDPSDTNRINELFRPFHTIKGIAGFLNLRDINRLTHEIETILDRGRKGELEVTTATVDLIFSSVDVLKLQLDAIRRHLATNSDGPCPQPNITEIMSRLRCAARGDGAPAAAGERARVGELLVAEGAVARSDVEAALQRQSVEPSAGRIGEILVDSGVASPGQVNKALAAQMKSKSVTDFSIRVDTSKLDVLVDAVGELVIAHSMVSMSEVVNRNDKLQRNVSQVTKIVRDVQETAMAMRMVQIGQTFQKMRRLVRDVARKGGKEVELRINGEETELDKNVIQQISDPLVHMVRNAIDHGIELPDERVAAGKPPTGVVTLGACHQGDSIVIEIRDDGRGMDPARLIAKGIERGMIGPNDQPTDQQAYALILAPGFSTAAAVTDISGRGVGMDVVRRNVEQLRGKIEIDSTSGLGSVFTIRLPLTLAIIDGMIVKLGHERVIIPTILIERSLRPERKQITSVQRRGEMLQVRGELCPLIQLGALFDYTGPIDPCENIVIIAQCEGQKIALVVEELIGQQQVVIKTLGGRFKQVQGVSGAAILGDGRVGLIIEPSGLLALYSRVGGGRVSSREALPGREPSRVDPAAVEASGKEDDQPPRAASGEPVGAQSVAAVCQDGTLDGSA